MKFLILASIMILGVSCGLYKGHGDAHAGDFTVIPLMTTSEFVFRTNQEGKDLVLTVNETHIGKIYGFYSWSNTKQQAQLDSLSPTIQYCNSKGIFGYETAIHAGTKIDTVEDQLADLKRMTKDLPLTKLQRMGNIRTVREAYRNGYHDPKAFGVKTIRYCMLENGT